MNELLIEISPDRPPPGWPRNPKALGAKLRRLTPALRVAAQIEVVEPNGREAGGNRRRVWSIDKMPEQVSRPEDTGTSSTQSDMPF